MFDTVIVDKIKDMIWVLNLLVSKRMSFRIWQKSRSLLFLIRRGMID